MKTKLAVALSLFAYSAIAVAQTTYHLTVIGYGVATGINSQGDVVGYSQIDGFVYHEGVLTEVGPSLYDGANTSVNAINDQGQVLGYTNVFSADTGPFIEDHGTRKYLGGNAGPAFAINNLEQVVGHGGDGAYLYSNGMLTSLGILPPAGAANPVPPYSPTSDAYGINDSGQVVGDSSLPDITFKHAFLYTGGIMHDLGTLPGTNSSFARGINNAGQIVGASLDDYIYHAFVYDAGSLHDLGLLSGAGTFAYGINNNGQIVGDSGADGENVGFVYRSGQIRNLNDMLDSSGDGWHIASAHSINDAGWIAADAYVSGDQSQLSYAVLLTPLPEPSTFFQALIAGTAVWLMRRLHVSLSLLAPALAFAFVAIATLPTQAANPYSGTDLYNINSPDVFQIATSIGGQVVDGYDALVWSSPSGVPINLNPPGYLISTASGTDGVHQVGYAYTSDFKQHAIVWAGTAASAVDLHPTNLPDLGLIGSYALGVSGSQQVGVGITPDSQTHALLWNGTANSAVDLTPTNISNVTYSVANATDGAHQVGNFGTSVAPIHAVLWNGSADSAVDLNPAVADSSTANGVFGSQQVGEAIYSGIPQATLWNSTVASVVDLAPINISGITGSTAYGTNGSQQVGWGWHGARDDTNHALVWSGTGASAIDLNDMLPFTAIVSKAYSIDAQGDIYGIAYDQSLSIHAVEWSPVPEPSAFVLTSLAAFGAAALFYERHRCLRHWRCSIH